MKLLSKVVLCQCFCFSFADWFNKFVQRALTNQSAWFVSYDISRAGHSLDGFDSSFDGFSFNCYIIGKTLYHAVADPGEGPGGPGPPPYFFWKLCIFFEVKQAPSLADSRYFRTSNRIFPGSLLSQETLGTIVGSKSKRDFWYRFLIHRRCEWSLVNDRFPTKVKYTENRILPQPRLRVISTRPRCHLGFERQKDPGLPPENKCSCNTY